MIELKYSKQFLDGLCIGVMGDAAGIYSPAQMEAVDVETIKFNFSGVDVYLVMMIQPDLVNCTIDIFGLDNDYSNCLDGAIIRDNLGVQHCTIEDSQSVLPRDRVIAGFQIDHKGITLNVSPPSSSVK